MEDTAYKNAIKRRQEIQDELKDIDKFLYLWNRYAGTELEQTALELSSKDASAEEDTGAGRRTGLPREQLIPHIRDVLITHGKPMTRGQLVEALTAKNIIIGGTDRSRNLGTILWRLKDEFTNIEGHGYWPKELPCERVGYQPEGDG